MLKRNFQALTLFGLLLSGIACATLANDHTTPPTTPGPTRTNTAGKAKGKVDLSQPLLVSGGITVQADLNRPGGWLVIIRNTLNYPFYNAKIIIIDNPNTRRALFGPTMFAITMVPDQTAVVRVTLDPAVRLQDKMVVIHANLH